MDSGGEEPAGEEDPEEPEAPSIANLAEELDPVDDSEDPSAPSSFADLVSEIERQRAPASEPGGQDGSVGSDTRGDDTRVEQGDAPVETGGNSIEWEGQQANAGGPEGVGVDPESVFDLVGDARNVLLVGELLSPAEGSLCTTLLGGARPANIVLVTLTQSPDERLAVCRRHLGPLPGRTAVVNVGDPVRSGDGAGRTGDADGSLIVESVADPTDLMRIGITISRQLAEFEDDDVPTVLCFHSLTALLQFVEDQRAIFRFIHTLRGRVRAAGGRAHYHLDDKAHDDQLVALLRPLFDVTIKYDEAGTVSSRAFP